MEVHKSNSKHITWLNQVSRVCECPPNHLNCLTGKEWVKAMVGVWEFSYESRDIRDKSIHPAVFPIALAKRVVSLFSHCGEVVLDPFNGMGTTLLACQDTQRHGIGLDLNPKYCKLAQKRVAQERLLPFIDPSIFKPYITTLKLIQAVRHCHRDRFEWMPPPYEYEHEKMPVDILWGSDALRTCIDSGRLPEELLQQNQRDLVEFEKLVEPYLLYV